MTLKSCLWMSRQLTLTLSLQKPVAISFSNSRSEKKTIFLNTHNLDEAQRICDRIAILNTKLMALGTPEELERGVGARRTVIQLEQVNDSIKNSLKRLSLEKCLVRRQQIDELSLPTRIKKTLPLSKPLLKPAAEFKLYPCPVQAWKMHI